MRFIKTLFFIFLFGIPWGAFSQAHLSGSVHDPNGNPIGYANVVLLSAKDSVPVRGTITSENGNFSFSDLQKNETLLKVSFIGYTTFLKKIDPSNPHMHYDITLIENTAMLKGVRIKVKGPKVYRQADRLIFKVENTSLSNGSAWDILQKTPGVIVMQGSLLVQNTPATIYLNGNKVRLPSADLKVLLQNYDGQHVDRIEVIANPPANFDAGSGPVLNIITSKNLTPGYKGSAFGDYTVAVYPKYTLGSSHFYKTKKLDLFLNYSFHHRKEFKHDDSYINFMNEQQGIFSQWRSDFDRTTRSKAHNLNLLLDYAIDERNQLSFQATTLFSPNKTFDNVAVTRIFDGDGELDSLYTTDSYLESDLSSIALDFGFDHQFQKEGTQLSAMFHFTNYDKSRAQRVASNYYDPDRLFLYSNRFFTLADQKTQLYSGKLDFDTDFGAVGFKSGVKISHVDSESGLNFFDRESNGTFYNEGLSDLFRYKESILAAYASVKRNWKKLQVQAGLRGERTNREGRSAATKNSDKRTYFDLFPSIFMSYTVSEKHQLSFNYGRKISRPEYSAMNPFKYFINENNFRSGNPDLKASFSNNFNLNYTYKKAYSFDLYFRDNGKNTTQFVFQDNQNLNIRTLYVNVAASKSYGLDFFHGRSINDWWYAQAVLSLFHEEETFLAEESGNLLHTIQTNGFYAALYDGFTLSKEASFSGDVNMLYISSFIKGSYKMKNIFNVSVGLQKGLWDERAEVSLHFADMFNTLAVPLASNYRNQDNGFFAHPENRFVRVGFKYNFGNYRLQENERSNHTEERGRL